jgi:hypothetical protein
VCPYLYHHPELFLLHRPLAPKIWQAPSLRITVDTPEDYERIRLIWEALSASPDPEDRFRGATVIAACRRLFPGGDGPPPGSVGGFPPRPAGASPSGAAAGTAGREPR